MTGTRPLLTSDACTSEVSEQIAAFHADFVAEVIHAVDTEDVVIVGMDQNPVVKKARRLLEKSGISYFYVGHGSYFHGYRRRLAVKMWSGYPTFPQVFVRGVLIGGCRELERDLFSGELQQRLCQDRPDLPKSSPSRTYSSG